MEDKMVVLRRFRQFSEANMLANLLQAEGVACYVRDNVTHQIFGDIDFVSVKIELLEKDLPRAEEIMKAYGYTLSDDQPDNVSADGSDEEETEAIEETDVMAETEDTADDFEDMETAEAEIIAYQKFKKRQARMLSVICILLIIVGGLIIILNKYYNEQ